VDPFAPAAALRPLLDSGPLAGSPRLVAGLDAAYARDGSLAAGAAVVWDTARGEPVAAATATLPHPAPYRPGRFFERELPVLLAALGQLPVRPDLLLADAHGTAHPERLGLACRLGLAARTPSVGCARSVLVGTASPPPPERGAWSPLRHRGEIVGALLRTRAGARTLVVSPGHGVTLEEAIAWTLHLAVRHRQPEPLRLAHIAARAALRAAGDGPPTARTPRRG